MISLALFVRVVPNRTMLRCMDLTDGSVHKPQNQPFSPS